MLLKAMTECLDARVNAREKLRVSSRQEWPSAMATKAIKACWNAASQLEEFAA